MFLYINLYDFTIYSLSFTKNVIFICIKDVNSSTELHMLLVYTFLSLYNVWFVYHKIVMFICLKDTGISLKKKQACENTVRRLYFNSIFKYQNFKKQIRKIRKKSLASFSWCKLLKITWHMILSSSFFYTINIYILYFKKIKQKMSFTVQ